MMDEKLAKCARMGCDRPAYTGNGIYEKTRIGEVAVYLCTECFAEYIQACMGTSQPEQDKE